MRFIRSIYTVDSHTMGEPTRVVVGGIPNVPGKTMMEKKEYLQAHYDHIRRGIMLEPRGHRDMFGSIILPPTDPRADLGIVFMDGDGFVNMCGHGSIGACSVAVETGLVEAREPFTDITLECPVGLIQARVAVAHGKAASVTITNVESFLYRGDVEADIPGLGPVKFDIAYGGNFALLIHASYFGVELEPENLPVLKEKAAILNDWANSHLDIQHPTIPEVRGAAMVEVWGPAKSPDADYQNAVLFGQSVDRSPCGVGTSAKMAALVAKGELEIGQPFVYESIIRTKFRGVPLEKTKVGGFDAIIPQITASAYITGFNHLVFDEEDPVLYGFRV